MIVVLIAVFCVFLCGSAFPVLKVSYEAFQMNADDIIIKVLFAGMRFLLAGIMFLFGLLLFNRKAFIVSKRQISVLILFEIVQTALHILFLL